MQVERCSAHQRESNAGPYPSAALNPAEVFRVEFYGKCTMMIFERHANLKYEFGNRYFWTTGYYVSTVDIQEKTLRKYIQEQEKQDQIEDKVSTKEYENPFKSQAR